MRETMLNDGRSHCEDPQQTREMRLALRSTIVRSAAVALMCLGVAVSAPGTAQAFPIGGYPDKCQGPYPNGGPACENRGGTVACTLDGDYMCCTKNDQGGQDCEQIESFKKPKDRLTPRIPGGQLQVAPGNNPPPKRFSPYAKQGAGAAIQRRGVEGEGSGSAQTEQEDKAPAPK